MLLRPLVISAIALALLAPGTGTLALPQAMTAGPGEEARSLLRSVQYRDRDPFTTRDTLIESPRMEAPRSLFRPYRFQFGPHYQPPPVTYEPPRVIYELPSERRRSRCAPRSRGWYESCAARYRSFDPNTGTYTTYAGQVRVCRCP